MEFTLHNLPDHQAVEQVLGQHAGVQASSIEAYLLFLRVASDVFAAQQKQLARFGLSDGKLSVLLQFLLADPTPLSPSQLAERVGVTRATITDLVAGLVRDGWLAREVSPQDGRKSLLHLTKAGHERLEQVLPSHFQRLQCLMQALDFQEQQDLIRLLTKISQSPVLSSHSASSPAVKVYGPITGEVEVVDYQARSIAEPDESGISLIETRLLEQFTGGLVGTGWADHVRVISADGSATFSGVERIQGTLDGRAGSFTLTAKGSTDTSGIVHGSWDVVPGSGTGELTGLRGHGEFTARGHQASNTTTYWFEGA